MPLCVCVCVYTATDAEFTLPRACVKEYTWEELAGSWLCTQNNMCKGPEIRRTLYVSLRHCKKANVSEHHEWDKGNLRLGIGQGKNPSW